MLLFIQLIGFIINSNTDRGFYTRVIETNRTRDLLLLILGACELKSVELKLDHLHSSGATSCLSTITICDNNRVSEHGYHEISNTPANIEKETSTQVTSVSTIHIQICTNIHIIFHNKKSIVNLIFLARLIISINHILRLTC